MDEIAAYLESTAKSIAEELIQIYSRTDHEHGLVFPRKRDGSVRISEQEAKTLFLYRVLSERRYCLSVEVPTEQTYRQKGSKEISARVDITLLRGNTKRCAHVEFKALNCRVADIRKDLEKLLRENSTGMWFHTLENANRGTIKSLLGKFGKAFASLSAHVETCGCSFLIAICVLRKGTLQLRWLDFTGVVENNHAVVRDAFEKEGTFAAWPLHQFGNQTVEESVDSIPTESPNVGTVGKGVREGFFVFAPEIASDTFLHLSARGESYRIRNYHNAGPNVAPPAILVPGYRALETLRASGIIVRCIAVSDEDATHNLIKEPGYWFRRIQDVNSQELSALQARLSKRRPPQGQ